MNKEFLHMQKLAGIITESEYKAMLNENTFYQEMVNQNPGWDEETVMDMVRDEYEKPEDWDELNADVSGDYEEHQEYLKSAEEWFKEIQSASPTVKVGDEVEVFDRQKNKFGPGKIVKNSTLEGSFMFAGDVEPDKIPAWEIKEILPSGKLGRSIYYPQYKEGKMFKKI